MSRVQELEKILTEAKSTYYLDERVISDAQFDAYEAELRNLDPKNKVLQSIGIGVQAGPHPIVKHDRPMGSLIKTNFEEELREFFAKWCNGLACSSEKLDGLSISLRFQQRELDQGVTRGDGIKGEEITQNFRLFKGLPALIPIDRPVAVRGEAILLLEDWRKYFPRTELPDGTIKNKNARNSVACIRRKEDNSDCRYISFIAYDFVYLDDGPQPTSKEEVFVTLKSWGFQIPNYVVGNIDKIVKNFKEYADSKRAQLPYEIDGHVVEADDLVWAKEQGVTDDRPRAARAHKFEALTGASVLRGWKLQVGRTGIVTPVAVIDPVDIGGVTVESPSLMNLAEVCRLRAGVGSKITVERCNDVIPRIIKAEGGTPFKLQPENGYQISAKFDDNEICHPLTKPIDCTFEAIGKLIGADASKASSIFLFTEEQTTEGTVKRLDNFLKVLDVKGVGESTLASLVASKKATTIPELLSLSQAEWAVHCSGDKMALKIVTEIKSKTAYATLPKFVKSLGLPFFGEDTTERLEEAGHDTVDKILALDMTTLLSIPGIKEAKAEAVVRAIKEDKELIKTVSIFVKIAAKVVKPTATGHALSGKKICFTGVRLKGDEKAKFETAGAEEASGVNKTTDILVCKDPSASSNKLDKARELGVKIMSLDEFVRQL